MPPRTGCRSPRCEASTPQARRRRRVRHRHAGCRRVRHHQSRAPVQLPPPPPTAGTTSAALMHGSARLSRRAFVARANGVCAKAPRCFVPTSTAWRSSLSLPSRSRLASSRRAAWRAFDGRRSQVFIADDAFGSTEYRPDAAERWAREMERILRVLDDRHWLIWTSHPAPLCSGGGAEIAAHSHFTPERIRRLVAGAKALPGSLGLARILGNELTNTTEAMATSFGALRAEHRDLVVSMLDTPPGPVTERDLASALRRHHDGALPHPPAELVDWVLTASRGRSRPATIALERSLSASASTTRDACARRAFTMAVARISTPSRSSAPRSMLRWTIGPDGTRRVRSFS